MSDKEKPKDDEKKIITLDRSKRSKTSEPTLSDDEGEFVREFVIGISQNGGYALSVVYNTGDSDLFLYSTKDELIDILKSALI